MYKTNPKIPQTKTHKNLLPPKNIINTQKSASKNKQVTTKKFKTNPLNFQDSPETAEKIRNTRGKPKISLE